MLVNILVTFDTPGRRYVKGETPDVAEDLARQWIKDGKASANTTGQAISTGGGAGYRKRKLAQIIGQLISRRIDLGKHEVSRLPATWAAGRYGQGTACIGASAGNTTTVYVCGGVANVNSTTNQSSSYGNPSQTMWGASSVEPVRDPKFPYRIVRTSDGLLWQPFDLSDFTVTTRPSLCASNGSPIVPTVSQRLFYNPGTPTDASSNAMVARILTTAPVTGTTSVAANNTTTLTFTTSFYSAGGQRVFGDGIPAGVAVAGTGSGFGNTVTLTAPVTIPAGTLVAFAGSKDAPTAPNSRISSLSTAELAALSYSLKTAFSTLLYSPNASLEEINNPNAYILNGGLKTAYTTDSTGAFKPTTTSGLAGIDVSFETAAKSVAISFANLTFPSDGSVTGSDAVPVVGVSIDGVFVDIGALQSQQTGAANSQNSPCWQWNFPDSRTRVFRLHMTMQAPGGMPAGIWTSTEDTIHPPGYQSSVQENWPWLHYGDSTWAGAGPYPWTCRGGSPGWVLGNKLGLGLGIMNGQGGTGWCYPVRKTAPNQSGTMNFIDRLYANQASLDTRLGAPDIPLIVLDISLWDIPTSDATLTVDYRVNAFTQYLRDLVTYQPNAVLYFVEPRINESLQSGAGFVGFALDAQLYPIPTSVAAQDVYRNEVIACWRTAIANAGLTDDQYGWIGMSDFSDAQNRTNTYTTLGWVLGDGVHPTEWYAVKRGLYLAQKIRQDLVLA